LERAARLSDEKGGGSITALPIIETQDGDVSGYIPTNVISITDGQIFLTAELFNKGVRPAIDVGISVSRVGSSAQTKATKAVAGTLKLELAQFRELEAFMQFAQDLDKATADRIATGQRMVELLKQKNGEPMPMEIQAVDLYAGVNKLYMNVPVSKIREAELAWLNFVEASYKSVFVDIKKTGAISDDNKATLNKAMEEFKSGNKEYFV
jgi:F-type H+-transporting ATPase subunit alpha